MNHAPWSKIFIAAFIICIIGVGGVLALGWDDDYQFSGTMGGAAEAVSIHETETIASEMIETIKVETSTVNVLMVQEERNDIHVELRGEKRNDKDQLTLEISQQGEQLTINVREKSRIGFHISDVSILFSSGSFPSSELTVKVPEQKYEQLDVHTSTGNLTMLHPVQAERMIAKSSTGNIKLDGFSGEELNLRSSTGNMDISQVRAQVDIQTSTGNIRKLELLNISKDVRVRTSTGNAQIIIKENPTVLQLELSTSTGRIAFESPANTYNVGNSKTVNFSIGEGSKPELKVSSSTGNIDVQIEDN